MPFCIICPLCRLHPQINSEHQRPFFQSYERARGLAQILIEPVRALHLLIPTSNQIPSCLIGHDALCVSLSSMYQHIADIRS